MIDFRNGALFKLKRVDSGSVSDQFIALLLPEEKIIGTYKGMRDYVVFTDLRIIAVNVQGATGVKQDFTSMPYKKINLFSVETAGAMDNDSELELYFSGVDAPIKFEFSGGSDITRIARIIGTFVL